MSIPKNKRKKPRPLTGVNRSKDINKAREAFAIYLEEQGDGALCGVEHELYAYVYYASQGITLLERLSDYIQENRRLFLSGNVTDGAIVNLYTEEGAKDFARNKLEWHRYCEELGEKRKGSEKQ